MVDHIDPVLRTNEGQWAMGRGRHDLGSMLAPRRWTPFLHKVIVNSRQIYGCVGHA